MKNTFIPLYREKEIYTLFYDTVDNKIYKFPHRKKSSLAYIGLFFVVFYGSSMLNDVYQSYQSTLFDIVLFLGTVILCYFFAKRFMKNYYIPQKDRAIYFDEDRMEQFAKQGMKQLRMEVYLGLGVGMLMTIFGFMSFAISSQFELLIIGGLGLVPLFILFFTRPFTRRAILGKFQSKEIKL